LALSKLMAIEKTRDAYHQIWALKGCKTGNSISQVEIDTPSGTEILLGQQAIEHQLCQSLQTCFTKAHGSPFLHGQLAQDIGPYGCGLAATAILDGTYACLPEANEYTRMFIEALRWPHARPDLILLILSPEVFCSHWRRAKEHTSSSHSGLHFGHYKAASSSLPMAHLHTWFTQLVFMTGISLSRYQSGLQAILGKRQEQFTSICYEQYY